MRHLLLAMSWLRRHVMVEGLTTLIGAWAVIGCGQQAPIPATANAGTGAKSGDSSTTAESPKPNAESNDPAKAAVEPSAVKPVIADPDGWSAVISSQDIEEEVSKIRLRLRENLASLGAYNAHYNKEIRWDGAALAALAAVALAHPDKVSWHEQAAQIRDLAAELVARSKGLGPQPYDATKKVFETMNRLMAGDPPPGLPMAVVKVAFDKVASRRNLMHSFERETIYLRNFKEPGPFQVAAADVVRSASLLAAFCKVLGTKGYSSAEEKDYQQLLKALMDTNLTMAKAARKQDFVTFSAANIKVVKCCADCHSTYQSGAN